MRSKKKINKTIIRKIMYLSTKKIFLKQEKSMRQVYKKIFKSICSIK